MAEEILTGKITFINHDKDYATIEYLHKGKKKNISGNISEKEQQKLKAEKIIKKVHHFHLGDEVSFVINSSARGDKMIADCIEFRFNNALDNLVNRAKVENRFVGYLKKIDDDYFVKETGSYIFFPLIFSPWERKPSDTGLNEPFFFKLNNIDKPHKATAAPYKSFYIPEYINALKYFKNKTVIDGMVYKVTPHGIFVHIISDKMNAKISLTENADGSTGNTLPKIGDIIKIRITYLSDSRIIIEKAISINEG